MQQGADWSDDGELYACATWGGVSVFHVGTPPLEKVR